LRPCRLPSTVFPLSQAQSTSPFTSHALSNPLIFAPAMCSCEARPTCQLFLDTQWQTPADTVFRLSFQSGCCSPCWCRDIPLGRLLDVCTTDKAAHCGCFVTGLVGCVLGHRPLYPTNGGSPDPRSTRILLSRQYSCDLLNVLDGSLCCCRGRVLCLGLCLSCRSCRHPLHRQSR
jgi:hypothetical protein